MKGHSQTLAGREIHVLPVRLEGGEATVERARAMLAGPELERAEKFRFERHRRAFLLAHGSLRTLLGQYLTIEPSEVRFEYGTRGKPSIPGRLCFNQSDSGEFALFAFALDCELGVDIERTRPVAGMEAIAARFFSHEESLELLALSPVLREQAFFAAWTRKEAYIKAIGDGLLVPLDSFRVTLRPGEEARFVHLGGSPDRALCWKLHTFEPAAGYQGALAYPGDRRDVRLFAPLDAGELLHAN